MRSIIILKDSRKLIKQMHKPQYKQIYNSPKSTQKQLIFINIFVQYNILLILRTQLQGFMHRAADSIRPSRTQLRSLYLTTNTHDLDL